MSEFVFWIGGNRCLLDMPDAVRLFGHYIALLPGGYLTVQIGAERQLVHRAVMGLEKGDSREVDHINGVRADNRRSNLRLATTSQNGMNRKARPDSRSGITGVHWCPERERWCAAIAADGKRYALGRYVNKEDAIAARLAAEDRYHGQFAARLGAQRVA